ncbi:TPA: hypothetical protein HA239_00760 [Candidatus Woesearchaeota archaeon]|nr:hypothetical protein QT06_C0001G0191 [archaeon GW2011_AR15]MBS3104006.1 hypothetical protein [Candidatus Woesearchaeota archaeon]HIH40927.1 hypothetical protein [Candidatus Woesearchaeota archaeon]
MKPKMQEEVPISIYDLKKEMTKIKKRDEELSVRAAKTEEYLNNFVILKPKDAEALEEELLKLEVPRLKEVHVKKILDLLPASVEELKVILQGYTLTVNKENMEKMISTLKKYIPNS